MKLRPLNRRKPTVLSHQWRCPITSLALAIACTGAAQADNTEQSTTLTANTPIKLEPMKVIDFYKLNQDEEKKDAVYDENVTSVYQDREQLQRFKATNPSDVFKGMNGVYSMDSRSSQSITPNIRGITGEGRTPLTIDGTEQSTNVWLHMFGSGNRSYVDPALFRSIEVEKGPSLSRGIKSGVGGAVNIRTIEANDIIPEGESWGIETNIETSGNTSATRFNAESFYGKDYRDIPGASRLGQMGIEVPYPEQRYKGSSENLNFDDHSEMLTIAGRNEFADILISRSERTTGNYYAGDNNADRYSGYDSFDTTTTDRYIPNLIKLYPSGSEVFNTASKVDTTLIKNHWYFPNEQKIGLQFMRTNTIFGETVPGDSILYWGYREAAEQSQPDVDWSQYPFVFEKPHSDLVTENYKLSYDFKPEGSKWLNLETSLWHTTTEGERYQSGVNPFGYSVDEDTQQALDEYDFNVESFPEFADWFVEPEHDGTIIRQGRQWTQHDRTGFDFNNQIQLSDRLQLILGGSYQKEKLNEQVQASNAAANGIALGGADLHITSELFGPRSGERQEYSAMFNLAWQPTDWLTLTAGTRYLNYTGKDTGTAKRRNEGDDFYAAEQRKDGVELTWGEPLTVEEVDEYTNMLQTYGVNSPEFSEYLDGRQLGHAKYNSWSYPVWEKTAFVPYKDGKLDSSQNPFANGEIDTALLYDKVIEAQGANSGEYEIKNIPGVLAGSDTVVYQDLDAGQAWEAPEEQSGDAFSPVFSATARITPHSTGFLRYAQTTRFPSVNELTSSAVIDGAGTIGTLAINGASKPERSINWELGYSHDLTQFFPNMYMADVRLSYYNTKIKDFIDRDDQYDVIQFDEKKTSGLELQSRFDTGRYFGSLGVTYRLEQKLCDKDYASGLDLFYNRIPECMTGGFPGTYSGSSLQPKYSINMGLGARFLSNQLELGWRGVYHAGAENKQLDQLLSSENPDDWGLGESVSDAWFRNGVDTFYWRSVLLHDLYVNYNVNNSVALNLGITNITDEYYLDPMAKTLLPGPGRTVTAGLKVKF